MKNILKTLLILFSFIFILAENSFSQDQDLTKQGKKNTIEVIQFPLVHNFNSPMKYVFMYGEIQNTFPRAYGIQYTRKLNNQHTVYVKAVQFHYYRLKYGTKYRPGQSTFSTYGLFSSGYMHEMVGNNIYGISGVAEVHYIYGAERFHSGYKYVSQTVGPVIDLGDIGLAAGLHAKYKLPYNFQISCGAMYSRYVYRNDNGQMISTGDIVRASPNKLTLQLGLGYNF